MLITEKKLRSMIREEISREARLPDVLFYSAPPAGAPRQVQPVIDELDAINKVVKYAKNDPSTFGTSLSQALVEADDYNLYKLAMFMVKKEDKIKEDTPSLREYIGSRIRGVSTSELLSRPISSRMSPSRERMPAEDEDVLDSPTSPSRFSKIGN